MDFEQARIFDSNGQKYRVGIDEHGWLSIESGEMLEQEGKVDFYPDDNPVVSFPPDKAPILAAYIEDLFE